MAALAGHRIVRVAAGQQHAAAVTADGRLYTWGSGVFGIGHGDGDDLLVPRQVEGTLASLSLSLSPFPPLPRGVKIMAAQRQRPRTPPCVARTDTR
jgi:alpha-tubulin suppressor-like RCC1 family protein